jgi:ubiquinone/menaquinone biosynthesis C-methylase UbiE
MSRWKQKRSVMRRYDLTAQMYDQRYCDEQEAKYKAALESLTITRNSLVLDVGCGTGLFFSHVANKAEAVVGVDVSRGLLLQAKERARGQGNVFVVQADADHLPFKQGFFSFIFAFTVLQNMPKPVETLKEITHVAKREASIVVTGLKRAVDLEVLGEWLEHAGLLAVSLRDDDALQCRVVVAVQA